MLTDLENFFWGKGYGTEVAKAILNYGFATLNLDLIDADANKENNKSIKILEKFMNMVNEFWNENDNCFDVRYRVKRNEFFKPLIFYRNCLSI